MKSINKRRSVLAVAVAMGSGLLVHGINAAEQAFDLKDPKNVNNIVVTLDSAWEPTSGLASGITGNVTFDPQQPKNIKGKITVDATSLKFSNATYTDAAHSSRGLNTEKFPSIVFDIKDVPEFKTTAPNVYEAQVAGDFTLHGVTNRITIPVTATLLPGKVKDRSGGRGSGDLLVLRSHFKIKRTDYGINPPLPAQLLADEIDIRVAIAGHSPAK